MRRSLIVIAFVLPFSLARADPNPPQGAGDPAFAEGKAHFDRGVTLMDAHEWDAALAEFLAARALRNLFTPTKNAAICLRHLQRFDEAMEMYETIIRDFPDLPSAKRQFVDQQLTELSERVGTLAIDTEPGASIVVDGRDRGVAPLEKRVRVSAGTHVVRVSKTGFEPFETKIEVAGKSDVVVSARLKALAEAGRLKVMEEGGLALEVTVDSAAVGTTPWEGSVAVGDHTVLLRGSDRMGAQPVSAPVRRDETTTLMLKAEPLPASLRVEPIPGGASVAIDGVFVGRGVWKGAVRLGPHRVEAAAEGFLPLSRTVRADAPGELSVSIELERDPSSALWRAQNPARFFLAARGGPSLAAVYGGDVVDDCTGSCSDMLGVNVFALAQVGYRLPVGIDVSIDAGYLSLRKKISGRATAVTAPGNVNVAGQSDDLLLLRGILIGASAAFRRGTHVPWQAGLGAGALLAGSGSDRMAFVTTSAPFRSFTQIREAAALYGYVAADARIGMQWGPFDLDAGLSVLLLLAASQPTVGAIPDVPLDTGSLVTIPGQSLAGRALFVVAPTVGARYEF